MVQQFGFESSAEFGPPPDLAGEPDGFDGALVRELEPQGQPRSVFCAQVSSTRSVLRTGSRTARLRAAELTRGVFRQADAPPATDPDALAVAWRAPHAVLCYLTAAAIHDLTDEIPSRVQLAVAAGRTPPRIKYPPVEVFRLRSARFHVGISTFEAAPGEQVRVYDPTRTVVDLILMKTRFGESIAYTALNRYLNGPTSDPRRLRQYAQDLGIAGPVTSAMDIVRSQ